MMGASAMGVSPERSRRATGVEATEPLCDEVYRMVAKEFLKKHALERDEEFTTEVARRFKEGPAKISCRSIGTWIDQKLGAFGWSQHNLADRIGVDRSAVARWTSGGTISLGHLVLVLIEFGSDFADLPFPVRRELVVEAYLAALSHVRERLSP
ncbi:helix-turn-helix domain-containing protein, partial [Singulisphaera rosea]